MALCVSMFPTGVYGESGLLEKWWPGRKHGCGQQLTDGIPEGAFPLEAQCEPLLSIGRLLLQEGPK